LRVATMGHISFALPSSSYRSGVPAVRSASGRTIMHHFAPLYYDFCLVGAKSRDWMGLIGSLDGKIVRAASAYYRSSVRARDCPMRIRRWRRNARKSRFAALGHSTSRVFAGLRHRFKALGGVLPRFKVISYVEKLPSILGHL